MVTTPEDLRAQVAARRSCNVLWLLQSKSFSDFEIHCKDHIFFAHRAILALDCQYLKTLTTSAFKECDEQRVVFDEDEPAIIARYVKKSALANRY